MLDTLVAYAAVPLGWAACTKDFLLNHYVFTLIFFFVGFFSVVTYLFPILLQNLVFDNIKQDLKKKYNAKWALVTGASSGASQPTRKRVGRRPRCAAQALAAALSIAWSSRASTSCWWPWTMNCSAPAPPS